jgi:endonuclease-8
LRRAPRRVPQPGEVVTEAEARGKHLLVHFSGGLTLHTHLGMDGAWQIGPSSAPWRRAAHTARVIIECGDVRAICYAAPTIEVLERRSLVLHPALRRLGPDLYTEGPDVDEAVARLANHQGTIAEALLDQSVASGIGNIWRNEALHAARVHPLTPVRSLDEARRRSIVETAARMLRASDHRSYAVYRRAHCRCRTCGATIERAYPDGRSVYWCPGCQRL